NNFSFKPGNYFKYLKQDDILKLKFQYTINDTQYNLDGTGVIELTINGTATAPTAPTNPDDLIVGKNGEFTATETNGSVPNITVPKDEILYGWTLPDGLNAYSIIPGAVSFEKWSSNQNDVDTTNPFSSTSLGSTNIVNGNLVFMPATAIYKSLGEGQWVDIAVSFSVRNANGTTSGGKILFRIEGTNDAPTISYENDSFNLVSNSTTTVQINPGFTKNDPDWNDDPSSLIFSIDETSSNRGFNIDTNGVISISNDKKPLLADGDYKITVTLKDYNGGKATKEITVHVFKESNPVLSKTELSVSEKNLTPNITKDLNNAITKKTDHSYTFTTFTLKKILLNGEDYVLNLNNDYYQFNRETGVFSFNPTSNNLFDFLTKDDILNIEFTYKVSDNGYVNCESTGSFVVIITGVNDQPISSQYQTSDDPKILDDVTESVDATTVTINDLLNGWTDADHSNEQLKISDVWIAGFTGATFQHNELTAVQSELFIISPNGREVTFNSSHNIFRKLANGESVILTVGYTVEDPKDGEGTGYFKITVKGKNDPPTLVNKSLIVSQNDTSRSVSLIEGNYNEKGQLINASNYSYSVTLKTNSSSITLRENDDYKIENGIFSFLAGSKFVSLQTGEFAILTFTYNVTDKTQNGNNSASATLTVTINGVNDAPTITCSTNSNQVEFHVPSNYVADTGETITIANFNIEDVDTTDTLTLSVQVQKAWKGNDSLLTFPTFAFDANGNLTMTKTGLPELLPGESARFTVYISATDTRNQSDYQTITVIVHAKQYSIIDLKNSNNNSVTDWCVGESDSAISESLDISVTDVEEAFNPVIRTHSWYTLPQPIVSVKNPKYQPQEYQDKIGDPSSFFSITGTLASGYKLNFNSPEKAFDFLKAGEKLEFTVTISVLDTEYGVTTTKELTFTVTGTGDNHTVSDTIPEFDFWANEKNPESAPDRIVDNNTNTVIFKPNYQFVDPDWNETYQYALVGTHAGISIDPATGYITLNRNNLNENIYNLTISVTSTSDAHSENVDVTIKVLFAKPPVVSGTDDPLEVDEGETGTAEIEVTTNTQDNAPRNKNDDNWYTIGGLSLDENQLSLVDKDGGDTLTIPDDIDIAAIALAAASFVGNKFQFNPDTNFDFLPEGAVLTLTYHFTVFDAKYDVSTEETITVTITGKNSTPKWNTETNSDLGDCDATYANVAVEEDILEINIANLVYDVDLGDSLKLYIDNTEVEAGKWVEIKRTINGVDESLGKFYYNSSTKILQYKASGDYLARIKHGTLLPLEFSFSFEDALGSSPYDGIKVFTINVIGTNKQPVAKPNNILPLTPQNREITINLDDIATDKNDGDILNFYTINGTDVTELESFVIPSCDIPSLEIIYNKTNKNITIRALDGYNWNLNIDIILTITVTDDFGAHSEPITITINLPKTNQ
ncbi:MAG: VCBS domain-containing protein, partial [Planctomycetaceae bacterium]|nr:VCBS domain-containing protein [Planctomycetaceae bacterium]